jgi:hypothetical protein
VREGGDDVAAGRPEVELAGVAILGDDREADLGLAPDQPDAREREALERRPGAGDKDARRPDRPQRLLLGDHQDAAVPPPASVAVSVGGGRCQ